MATPELSWLIVRNNNAFLRKVRNVKQPFSSVSPKHDHIVLVSYHADALLLSGTQQPYQQKFVPVQRDCSAQNCWSNSSGR